jgi:preprotein translocase subunit SecA
MREVERRVMLSVLDRKWREHLYEMDYLKEGIGLRAMAQRDPLVEYQREGFALSGVGVGRPRTGALHYTAPSESGGVEERDERSPASASALTDDQLRTTPKNSPCPCGSGKKFKMCHGRR